MIEVDCFDIASDKQIHDVGEFVSVTMPIPKDIVVKEGEVLAVYRINDDATYTKCTAVVNQNETFTFKTDHFSTFVVVAEKASLKAPQTENNDNLMLWIGVIGISGLVIIGVKRKKNFF